MVFLKMRGDEVEYMRMDIKELLPLFSKNDDQEICQIYGKSGKSSLMSIISLKFRQKIVFP